MKYDGTEFVYIVEAMLRDFGISKTDFYSKAGISSASMSQWRNGKFSPTESACKKIADALNLTQEEFDSMAKSIYDAMKYGEYNSSFNQKDIKVVNNRVVYGQTNTIYWKDMSTKDIAAIQTLIESLGGAVI